MTGIHNLSACGGVPSDSWLGCNTIANPKSSRARQALYEHALVSFWTDKITLGLILEDQRKDMDIQKINWRILEDPHSDTDILNAYLTKLVHCVSIDFIPHAL